MFVLCLVCGEIKRERSDLLLKIGMWDKKADRVCYLKMRLNSMGKHLLNIIDWSILAVRIRGT